MDNTKFSDLIGKTLVRIDCVIDGDEIIFVADDGRKWRMHHDQDCCERVSVESIVGDLDDLIGSPILVAEEVTSSENPPGFTRDFQDFSYTWTFYKLATRKGYVDIRWYGESNGYYSEQVSFNEMSH